MCALVETSPSLEVFEPDRLRALAQCEPGVFHIAIHWLSRRSVSETTGALFLWQFEQAVFKDGLEGLFLGKHFVIRTPVNRAASGSRMLSCPTPLCCPGGESREVDSGNCSMLQTTFSRSLRPALRSSPSRSRSESSQDRHPTEECSKLHHRLDRRRLTPFAPLADQLIAAEVM